MGSKPSSIPNIGVDDTQCKKSLYRRYEDAKSGRNNAISDEDMIKFTGMTRTEVQKWSQHRPGVGGNRNAGDITAGPASGLGSVAASAGYGGWGTDARGDLKFPPKGQHGQDSRE